MIKMKFNWLFWVISDVICSLAVFEFLFGHFKRGTISINHWIAIVALSSLVPIIFHLCIRPFFYYYVDEKGIGVFVSFGIGRINLFKGLTNYRKWADITSVGYLTSPIWNGLWIDENKKQGFYLDFRFLTNKIEAIKIILRHLPRTNVTPGAEKFFFQKWERKIIDKDLLI